MWVWYNISLGRLKPILEKNKNKTYIKKKQKNNTNKRNRCELEFII